MILATQPFLPTPTMQMILPFGLIGLGKLVDFELSPIVGSEPFFNLRSIGEMELEFLAIEGPAVLPHYSFKLSDEETTSLGLDSEEDALVLNLVTVHSLHPQHVTVNLAGPIIVNRRTLLGKQLIVGTSDRYPTNHPLIDERRLPLSHA